MGKGGGRRDKGPEMSGLGVLHLTPYEAAKSNNVLEWLINFSYGCPDV
jgi:hypothetical protein